MSLQSVASVILACASAAAANVVYVPAFEKYPGYTGNLEVSGSMTIVGTSGTDLTAKQTLTWSLRGLDTACVDSAGENVTNGCGIHVHEGTTCATASDVGGHFYSGNLTSDPWAPVTYVAAADGTSNEHAGVQVVTGLSNEEITGRVMVVHALASGERIACGVIGTETGAGNRVYVASFAPYPGYNGANKVSGSMTIVGSSGSDTTAKQTMTWSLSGLDTACEPNAAENFTNGCGIHVHTGTSCDSAGEVGGHYYSGSLSSDPWAPVVYVASADGTSQEHQGVQVVTGLSNGDITGRVMVVHALDGARIACAVIGTETGAGNRVYVASFAPYPGYNGAQNVVGSMTIVGSSGSDTTAKQTLTWSLSGLDTACGPNAGDNVKNGCGIHVHTGTSCDSAAEVGGHYYSDSLSSDPWAPIVYVASADGTSQEHQGVQVVTGLSNGDITGRVMVVHALADGARIACAVIGTETGAGNRVYVASFAPYPDYAGNLKVTGSMTVVSTSGTDTTATQTLTWNLKGTDPACKANAGDDVANGCGVHVHSGTSCDVAADVGGHYYSSSLSTDPWAPIVYVTSAEGTSVEEAGVPVVTGLSTSDILGRVMVVHELASGARIACGVIGATAPKGGDFLAPEPSFAIGVSSALPCIVLAILTNLFVFSA